MCVFPNRFSKKYSNIKFHENPSIEIDRQTDRHEEFTQFCERYYKRGTLDPNLVVAPQKFKKS